MRSPPWLQWVWDGEEIRRRQEREEKKNGERVSDLVWLSIRWDLVSSGAQGVDYVMNSHHRLDPSVRAARGGAKSNQIKVAYKPVKRVTSDPHVNHVVSHTITVTLHTIVHSTHGT
jgi:hypothetical protein